MEKIECIYNFIVKTRLTDVLRDINFIDFAILSSAVIYKTNVYNKMREK